MAANLASEPAALMARLIGKVSVMPALNNKCYRSASTNVIETVDNFGFKMPAMDIGQKIKEAREAKGLSQADLGRLVGISQPAIKKIEAGETKQSKYLPKVLIQVGLDMKDYDASFPTAPTPGASVHKDQLFNNEAKHLEVFSAAEGGPGEVIVSADPVDFIPRPFQLLHVKDAYGLIIVGESMWPEFRPGEIVHVDPNLPAVGGEPFIFYAEKAGEARATIKNLRRATPDKWLVSQWNPAKDFTLPRGEWRWAHRVLGKQSRR